MNAPYTADIRLIEGMHFRAQTLSGHELDLDSGADAAGGGNGGSRPTELILAALGSCTAMDVLSILRKMRQEVSSYDVRVEGERAETHPRLFTQIRALHRLQGEGLVPRQPGHPGDEPGHPRVDLGHQPGVHRVDGVVEVEDPGVDVGEVGAHGEIRVPAPCSVNSSTSMAWGRRPSMITTASTPASTAAMAVSSLGIMPP